MEHIRVSKVDRVKMLDKNSPKSSPMGKLYVTTSHLIFIKDGDRPGQECQVRNKWRTCLLLSVILLPFLFCIIHFFSSKTADLSAATRVLWEN